MFVPNDEAINRVTKSNNITVEDLYNNTLNVLTLVKRRVPAPCDHSPAHRDSAP
jgi:hypothetical protein